MNPKLVTATATAMVDLDWNIRENPNSYQRWGYDLHVPARSVVEIVVGGVRRNYSMKTNIFFIYHHFGYL